jgi:multicomponent Na+:H+ antiporter subunit A
MVTAALLPLAASRLGTRVFYLAALPPLAAVIWGAANVDRVEGGRSVDESFGWVPELGLTMGLRFDGFAALMVGLVAGIGVLVFVYSRGYFHEGPVVGRFAATLLAFSGSMLGLVLSDNLMALFLFWEATSITSFLLIGTEDEKAAARSGALQALLITGGGGLAMLGGFVLLAEAAGTYSMSAILADPPSGTVVDWALVLVLVGALTKSAQVPFHSWLPRAMNAPTPVSAYLHSATMVKAGIYLVARFSPAFSDAPPWQPIVIVTGLATMIVGGYRALRQYDLKLVLAYGTISQLGLMMVLFGVATPESTFAACTLLVAHGIFKAALFMIVGVIDHQTHTRDLRVLDGLGRRWPVVAATAVVVSLSMAGFGPFLGFIAKEEALAGLGYNLAGWAPWSLAVVVVGSALTVAYSARFLWGAFGPAEGPGVPGHERVGPDAPHPKPVFIAPAVVLAVLTLLLGLVPGLVDATIGRGFQALWGEPTDRHLALWHGVNQALVLSLLAVAAGTVLFLRRERVFGLQERLQRGPSAQGAYDASLRGALHGADMLTGVVQNGSLPIYLGIILTTLIVVPGFHLLSGAPWPDLVFADTIPQLVIAAVMITCALAAAFARRRFAAVILIGAVGYGMAALFIVQGAPDLAITQLLIETIGVVIFVLVFRHLPDRFPRSRIRGSQLPRVLIALGAGVFIFLFTLAAVGSRTAPRVSDEYLARSYPEANGNNVVNVIIVDFRGFDTVGEITVLAVAVLGVASIVRSGRRMSRTPDTDRVPGADDADDPVAESGGDAALTVIADADGKEGR